jgi:hypothetical protein
MPDFLKVEVKVLYLALEIQAEGGKVEVKQKRDLSRNSL